MLGINCWFGRGVDYTRCSDRAALFLETQRSQRVSLSPRLFNKVDVHLELMTDKCTPYRFVVFFISLTYDTVLSDLLIYKDKNYRLVVN